MESFEAERSEKQWSAIQWVTMILYRENVQ